MTALAVPEKDVLRILRHAVICYIDTIGVNPRSHAGIKAHAAFKEVCEVASLMRLTSTPFALEMDIRAYVEAHPNWHGRLGARIDRVWVENAALALWEA